MTRLMGPRPGLGAGPDRSGFTRRRAPAAEALAAGGAASAQSVVEDGGGRESTTRTVERDAGRARCTTDHREGAAAARTAHWTSLERYVATDDSTGVTTPDRDVA